MYIPIFFGIDKIYKGDYENIPVFLENFYTCVCFCKKYNFPIIAQEQYFINPDTYGKYINLEWSEYVHHHEHVDLNLINEIQSYKISDNITKEILKINKTKDKAWINIMNNTYECLEKEILNILKQILKKDKIKALIVFRHNASISKVASKLKIPVIELEFTTLRRPVYDKAFLYFQFSNKYTTEEFNKRYEVFVNENKKFDLLERKEILNLVLSEEYKHFIDDMDKPEEFDFGVALGLKKDYESKSMKCMSNEALLKNVSNLCDNNEILLRMHPSGIANSNNLMDNFILDNSLNSIEFILKCKRIVSVLSNIGFEAMLFGKTSYVLGSMPFNKLSINSLDYIDENVINLKDLNYILFCYFVPYQLVFDKNYLDFRLSNPKESDIYKYHYKYIVKNRMKNNVKLNIRNNHLKQENEKNMLIQDNKILKEQIKKINEELLDTKKTINKILNSKSWKLTEPLRRITNLKKRL